MSDRRNPVKHVSSVASGVFISLAVYISNIATFAITNPSVAKIIYAVMFNVGIILVFAMSTKLFTGQVLMVTDINSPRTFIDVVCSLSMTFIGNAFGSLLFVLLVYHGLPRMAPEVTEMMLRTAEVKGNLSPLAMFLAGIICNFCVAGAVALHKKKHSLFICVLPVFVFSMLGGEHIVVNFTYFSLSLVTGTPFPHFFSSLLLVTAGNIVGGAVIAVIAKGRKS